MKIFDRRVGFLLAVVFLDMIGFGLIFPVVPDLIMELDDVSVSAAAEIGGMLLFLYAAMQFLFAPLIGGLSDRFGRRPILLASMAMLGVNYCIMALAPSLGWLYAGRILCGITGATWAAASAAIADFTEEGQRGAAFGWLSGAGALGYVLGPSIGGMLGAVDSRLPFVFASALAFLTVGIGLWLFEEPLRPNQRRAFRWSRANPLGTLQRFWSSRFVMPCLIVVFMIQIAGQALLSTWPYWGRLKFDWTALEVGLTVSLYGLLTACVQIFLVGRSISINGPIATAAIGACFSVLSYLMLAFAPNAGVAIAAIVLGAVSGLTFPVLQSMMVSSVSADNQGELQGAIASISGLAAIIGPPAMTGVFVLLTSDSGLYFPGAQFIVSACCMVLALAIILGIGRMHRQSSGTAS